MRSFSTFAGLQLCLCILVLLMSASGSTAQPHSDFDDGTLQGWMPGDVNFPFHGILDSLGGFMAAYDSLPGGGPLFAKAPDAFTGNLAVYKGVRWDERVYVTDPPAWAPTIPVIMGPDSTMYWEIFDLDESKIGQWHQRFVPFDSTAWEILDNSGTAGFSEVLHNVVAFYMSMNTTTATYQWESGVDNIMLEAPVPVSSLRTMVLLVLLLLGVGIAFMALRRRHVAA